AAGPARAAGADTPYNAPEFLCRRRAEGVTCSWYEDQDWLRVCIPTHRGETEMDGAPARWWRVGEKTEAKTTWKNSCSTGQPPFGGHLSKEKRRRKLLCM